ncbi:SET and MYND domain-containing protein 3, partial [Stegodyphus mimosarum]
MGDAKPTVDNTGDDKPTVDNSADDKPTEDDKPTVDKTSDAEPTVGKTADAKPIVDKTADAKPPVDKTADAKPPVDKTAEAKPKIQFYYPGDIIPIGTAYVSILRREMHYDMCENCYSTPDSMIFCPTCKFTKYCGKQCQEEAFADHQLECRILPNLPFSKFRDVVQMVGKVILKIKGKDWNEIKEKFGDTDTYVSFADLKSYTEELKDDSYFQSFCKEMATSIQEYIGEENMPEEDSFKEILGKVKINSLTDSVHKRGINKVTKNPMMPSVFNLFLGISKLKYCCRPTGSTFISRRRLALCVNKQVPKELEKVTYNCLPMVYYLNTTKVVNYATQMFFRECPCYECSLPYGTSVLTKILNTKKAPKVIAATKDILRTATLTDLQSLQEKKPKEIVDRLLLDQHNVLGITNILRLRLLALRSFAYVGPLEEKISTLEALAVGIEISFGSYCRELIPVYENLVEAYRRKRNVNKQRLCSLKLCRLNRAIQEAFK